jgi:peptidyl-prolyl cis-trans isomerase A (cyclophilin A)
MVAFENPEAAMKRAAAVLVLAVAACGDPAASNPPSKPSEAAPDKAAPAGDGPLYDPAHADASRVAPSDFKVRFSTSKGDFTVIVFRDWAPRGADRFYSLVKAGFFDECRFFRVVPNFVVQWGLPADPKVARAWEPARLMDDPVKQTNLRGMMTYAKSGPNTRTTQVFINTKDNTALDAQGFPPFAKVIEGMDVIDALTSEYGESPNQGRIQAEGNAYLQKEFPRLDHVKTARVVE